jgi:predicted membrane-bound mannosyltransferase
MNTNPATRLRAAVAPSPEFPRATEHTDRNPFTRAFPLPALPPLDVAIIAFLIIGGLFLRLVVLGDRPLHHDESLHATYSWYLMGRANPEYHYDPMMHGPLQFHMIAFFYALFGSSPFTARLWSVTCGTALIAVPLILYRQLGRWTTYILMTMLCLSPITLYFSRFAREDMQYALFTLLLVVSILRFVLDHREGRALHYRWLYVIATAFIMAYAAKESIYLTSAVLGAFIAAQLALELVEGAWWSGPAVGVALMAAGALGHQLGIAVLGALVIVVVLLIQIWASPKSGMVADALRAAPWQAWAIAGSIIVLMFVLLYWPIGDPATWSFKPGSEIVKTTVDIPGQPPGKPYSYSPDGLLGGLQYWQEQQLVARGGQPWFYYLLVIPLYEWTIVPFGIIGAVFILRRRRTMVNLFLLWWTVATFILYGYASEKMPWNSLHLVVPLATLAAIGLYVSITHAKRWLRYVAIAAAVVTGVFTLHNSFTLAYVNGANPVEYMVYVQTTQDVPDVYSEMQRLQAHYGTALPVKVDGDDVWPWAFYLREPSLWNIAYNYGAVAQYGLPTQPVLLVSDTNYPALATSLANNYVAFHEKLRWWNPEEYKAAYVDRFTKGQRDSRLQRVGYVLKDVVTPSTWGHILQWEVQRRPFTPSAWDNYGNQTDFYFLVAKKYVQYLSPRFQKMAQQQLAAQQQADPFVGKLRAVTATTAFGQGGVAAGSFTSPGPVAIDQQGDTLVGDLQGHRIVVLSPSGKLLRTIGGPGTGPGKFNAQYSPAVGGIAVAANGNIYATDTWGERVEEFSPSGIFIRSWGQGNLNQTNLKPNDFYGPRGIAIASNGNIYVADTGHRRIQVFDPTGKFVLSFGSAGTLLGQFNEPSSVAIDSHGHVFVADYWNQRVQELSSTGQPLATFTIPAWQGGTGDRPQIAVDSQDRVLVPDQTGSRILVYSNRGVPEFAWGGLGTGLSQLRGPAAVASTGNTILVNDAGNTRVLRYPAP